MGFTKPHGSREHFGSLVLGVYDKGKLVYVGHSGGGFSREMLATLHARMMKLRTDKKPFTDVAHEDKTTWIRPRLVCQVKFTEWTHEGRCVIRCFLACAPTSPRGKSGESEHDRGAYTRRQGVLAEGAIHQG